MKLISVTTSCRCGSLQLLTILIISMLATACAPAYKPVRRAVRVADIAAAERTRLTSRFVWEDGTPEHTIPGQSPEVVTDEAALGQSGHRVCVYYTMRTGAKHDAPFGEWQPTINGEPVFPEQETSAQQTFQVAGERNVVDASFLSNTAVGAFAITEPTTEEYTLVQRAAWFCPNAAPGGRLEFRLRRELPYGTASEGFIWTLTP